MSEDKKLVFEFSLPVRWADMDINGHVNNVRFFTYFEAARLAWFQSIRDRHQRNGQGPVVLKSSCHYQRSITYPETVQIKLFAGQPGRSSFTTFYELYCKSTPGQRYAEGSALMVWVDRASSQSQPLPDYMLSALAKTITTSFEN
ncbi:MAG: thioesterase family protein [Betaproteobacteria bacterium]|jgi:acyl-CoA thioester hydrolase